MEGVDKSRNWGECRDASQEFLDHVHDPNYFASSFVDTKVSEEERTSCLPKYSVLPGRYADRCCILLCYGNIFFVSAVARISVL